MRSKGYGGRTGRGRPLNGQRAGMCEGQEFRPGAGQGRSAQAGSDK